METIIAQHTNGSLQFFNWQLRLSKGDWRHQGSVSLPYNITVILKKESSKFAKCTWSGLEIKSCNCKRKFFPNMWRWKQLLADWCQLQSVENCMLLLCFSAGFLLRLVQNQCCTQASFYDEEEWRIIAGMVRRWRYFSENDVQQRTLSLFQSRFFLELHL